MSLNLEQLPDDVLLAVMQHLSEDDLLTCRLVCKRLGGLALYPDVWRRRRIFVGERCLCAVLQLAPCAETIEYGIDAAHCSASTMARCAAKHIRLWVGQRNVSAAKSAVAVRNQELLGRLRRVELTYVAATSPGAAVLLRTVAMCSGLEVLEVDYPQDLPAASCPVVSRSLTPSLKCFRCNLSEVTESFVNTVLAGHTTTLEEVDLIYDGGEDLAPARDTARLLSTMPNLRSLICGVLPGLKNVARCGALRDVDLRLFGYSVHHHVDKQEVVEFLRQATQQLRRVQLDFDGFSDQHLFCQVLLQALTSSPRPLLEHLSVNKHPQLKALARVLPGLPGLRRLTVYCGRVAQAQELDEELLLGITPATVPALSLLELFEGYSAGRCTHDWLHSDAVSAVLHTNPSLHILLQFPNACQLNDCQACTWGCHKEVAWNVPAIFIGLYKHSPGVCLSPKDHLVDENVSWLHFP